MLSLAITKAGLALCAALGISACDNTERTADELFGTWLETHEHESIFFCDPSTCHGIGALRDYEGELPAGARCHVPIEYYNDRTGDRGNYVFCEPVLGY